MKPADDRAFRLALHVCRACWGRVLVHEAVDGARTYRCSNCGVEAEGREAKVICACGAKLRSGASMGLVCRINDNPTPEYPAQVVATPFR